MRAAGFNRAVAFGGLASVWQFAAAPVTAIMIASFLTAEAQGFYYIFASLLALQTYVELGLSTVILNSTSHHFAHLSFHRTTGLIGDSEALSKLASLARFAFKWYGVASLVFLVTVGTGGYYWLARQGGAVDWARPWWVLIVLTGFQLWALPFNAMLEGCNQVTNVQRFRLSQLVLRSIGLWLALGFHWGLWAAVVGAAIAFLRDVYLLGFEYRTLFATLWTVPRVTAIRWKHDIWPMQWRLAVSGVVSYFLFQGFTPVMFEYYGPVVAGQMGMTMSLVAAVQAIALTWLQPQVPRFGMLVARGEYETLDSEWWRLTRSALAITAAAAVAAWVAIYGLNRLQVSFAERLLPPLPTALFLGGALFMAWGYCFTAYLRAHVREPLMVLSVVTSALMGILVLWFGSRYGALGAATVYLVVVGGISLPWEAWIWRRCRLLWHQPVKC
jgi:hypothetical protein